MWHYLLILAGCTPMAVLIGAIFFERFRDKRRGARVPVGEKLLRPAGYSLSRQLTDMWDEFMAWSFGAFLAAIGSVGLLTPKDFGGQLVVLAVFSLIAAACAIVAWRKFRHMRCIRLGLMGEQAIAEKLEPLIAQGYRIFHDLPGDGKWNLDHVVVGPGGVFCIETKVRTKMRGAKGEPDFRAVYDGKAIKFPRYEDHQSPEQALRNSRWLSVMLSKSTGETVKVQAIVALPGWMVETSSKEGDVKVLNGKQIPGYINWCKPVLSEKAIERIAFQLDQRCRDVEF